MPVPRSTQPEKMLSFAPTPIFSGNWDHHRPAVSSPLSSSPVRASSPLSPRDTNTLSQRQTQSSPLQPPKFSKFSTRPTRPNPLKKTREEAQEQRRRNFLQNVRQKSEDKREQRRDIEGQFLRRTYYNDLNQLSFGAPDVTDGDIEDAMNSQEVPRDQQGDDAMMDGPPDDEDLDAMIASFEEQQDPFQQPHSPTMSDPDYDDIFAELIAQERPHHQNQPSSVDHMDAMDEDSVMMF